MDHVVVLVLVVVVDKVVEVVVTSRASVVIPLDILSVILAAQLERGLPGLGDLLAGHV